MATLKKTPAKKVAAKGNTTERTSPRGNKIVTY